MKLQMLGVAVAGIALAFASEGLSQQQQPESDRPYLEHTETSRLHFMVPPRGNAGRVVLEAWNAQRVLSGPLDLSSAEIESVLKLKGAVQVRMCSPGGLGCEQGSMVLHADAVEYNEKTQEIDAHGDVRIEPYRGRTSSTVTPR
jgi:hypothetical protein